MRKFCNFPERGCVRFFKFFTLMWKKNNSKIKAKVGNNDSILGYKVNNLDKDTLMLKVDISCLVINQSLNIESIL